MIAGGRRVQLYCVLGIHRERNHGSMRSTFPITVHEKNSHMQEPIRTYYRKPWEHHGGAEQAFDR